MDVRFFWVDVFADRALAGNPLALVPDADGLDDATMAGIARELNQSETTFLVAPTATGADHRLRSFTPGGVEVLGAGHNAMGVWIWLARSGGLPDGRSAFQQQIGDAVLAVSVDRGDPERPIVTMTQSPPVFLRRVPLRAAIADALGLAVEDLDEHHAAEVVSTGAPHLLVPVATRRAVDRARPDTALLLELLAASGAEGCFLFAQEGESAAYARFFNPTVGIAEDPATGTAAGPLAAMLVRDGAAPEGAPVVIEQGAALGRPSRLEVVIDGDEVLLSGSGVVAGEGVLHL